MARTKKSPPIYEGGTVTVTSSYPHYIHLYTGAKARNCNGDLVEIGLGQSHTIVAGTEEIPLRSYRKPEEVVSWTLGFNEYGVVWRADGEDDNNPRWCERSHHWEMEVRPSGAYFLDSDPKNPLLTDDQFATLHEVVLRQMQRAAPYSELWSRAKEELARLDDDLFGPIPEDLDEAYLSYHHHRRLKLPHWLDDYPKLALNADGNKQWATQNDLDRGLVPGGWARIDVYWRCLDRQPGGNTDVHVACYTFDCATRTASARTFWNWDGTSVRRSEFEPRNLSHWATQTEPGTPFVDFLAAVRGLGTGDSECTIFEEAYDASAYDTTWTSREIVAFLPRPWSPSVHCHFPAEYRRTVVQFLLVNKKGLQLSFDVVRKILEFAAPPVYVPVARVHQRCVYGGYRWGGDGLDERYTAEVRATGAQRAALAAARDLVGMGRVNAWTDAGDDAPPCAAREDERVNETKDNSCASHMPCTLCPFYFDFPARNVASGGDRGTSADWVSEREQGPSREDEMTDS